MEAPREYLMSGSLEICHVMECTIGGTRRHIRDLTEGLVRRGHRVTLAASAARDPGFLEDLAALDRAGVRVVLVPMVREISPRRDLTHLVRLAAVLAGGRFDVIHTHSSKAGALGRTAALLAAPDAARVHTPHTFAFRFDAAFPAWKRRVFLQVERRLGASTDRMVHVSASERDTAVELGIVEESRAVVIENGIDPEPFASIEREESESARRHLGVRPHESLIGTVGLLNSAKGHLDLVEAAALLRRRREDVRFVVVGEGELRGEIERRIEERGLSGSFVLTGYRTDVPRLLAAMDVFCLPSLWEGMPYAVLEAMAAGLPCVVTDVDGSRDLVEPGRTGWIVPRRDPEALAAALERVLCDPEAARRMGEEARRRVQSRHTLDRMVDRHAALYEEAVARGRRRR